ncbi:EpsG family protein [Vibrio sp. 1865]|uniref:EpsG family protein n=1 Tax=unclassified Vibrio TaxID=2614977 RepID=UPI002964A9AB|nr:MULTISPECIES: EpsG family protein [unclassified Vibrio]MDW2092045.1 EpsG family protein [Vibrio sp. 1866]MDW3102128.1 EpsG family protein [Vibrio sp. 1874]MDW3199804.1 EpsG family protein [Vibrio sp. 1865]
MYIDSLIIYACVFIFATFLSRIAKGRFWLLSVMFLTLSFGFREFIGNDWEQYVNIFKVISFYKTAITIEPGAYLINYIAGQLSLEYGYFIVFFIYTFLTLIFTYKALEYYNCQSWFVPAVFLTGFLFFSNNAIRQALAVSFLLYSSRYVYTCRLKFVFLMVLSTCLFHYSSLLSILLIFVPQKTHTRTVYFLALLVSFVINKLSVVKYILLSVVSFVPYYGSIYLERVENFTSQEKGVGLVVIFYYMIVGFCIFHKDKLRIDTFNIYIYGSLLFLAGIQIEMWERIMIPYFYFIVVFLSALVSRTISRNWYSFFLTSLLLVALSFLVCTQILYDTNKNKVSPFYHLLLNKAKDEP